MRGSVVGQLNHIYRDSGIDRIGTSKHEADAKIREELKAAGNDCPSKQDLGEHRGIHGTTTRDNYLQVWKEFFNDQKAEYGKFDADKITPDDVERFLNEKIDRGVARTTVQHDAAALKKLQKAMNDLAQREGRDTRHDWKQPLREARERAERELDKDHYDRSFLDPRAVVDALKREDHQLVAKLQLEGGARVSEASKIEAHQLAGIHTTRQGQEVGVFCVHGKNGKIRAITMSPDTYRQLENHIEAKGQLNVDYDRYREGLLAAAKATGQFQTIEVQGRTSGQMKTVQDWGGTHGLRYNYAQESYRQHVDGGIGEREALARVSYEMGHNRPDITRLYLGA